MGHKFAELAFTPKVKVAQEQYGSRRAYSRMEEGDDHHDVLGPNEAGFIASRDSFYMATVSETGWPYIQHRGGQPASCAPSTQDARVRRLGGNRQNVSTATRRPKIASRCC